MKNGLPFFFLFTFSGFYHLHAQSPGSVSANLSFWIKANSGVFSDAGTTPAGDGSTVQQWNDLSSSPKNVSQPTAASRPVYLSNATDQLNYNPLLRYDGTKSMDASSVLATGNNSYDVFSVSTTDNTPNGSLQLIFTQGNSGTNFRNLQLGYNYFNMNTRRLHHNWNGSGYQTVNNVADVNRANLVEFAYDQSITTRSILKNGVDAVAPLNFAGFNLSANVGIGYERANNGSFHHGDIAEIIAYSAFNSSVSKNKIQSYLAMKYAITLSNSGGGTNGDYLSSAGTTVWDASDNSGYHNNIIGIARDDNSALTQRQSHQADDSTRIYLSTLAGSNTANTGSFSSDAQFVLMGSNAAYSFSTGSTEFPSGQGIFSRIDREWKITNTNFGGTFSLDVKLKLGPVTASDLRILVDDDGNFANATLLSPTINYSGGVVTISGISTALIPSNSTGYLTIVSMNAATSLPVELLNFTASPVENKQVRLNWQTALETNNDYFAIERSANGVLWTEAAKVKSTGNAEQLSSYTYMDKSPLSGTSYYRLRQTDVDGRYSLSAVKSVTIDLSLKNKVVIYPNPAISQVAIEGNKDEISVVTVYDAAGRDLTAMVKVSTVTTTHSIINLTNLVAGVYVVKTKTGSITIRKR